jgi:hypothetical protein
MGTAVITSLMMYYVQYVVAPEYSNGCIAGDLRHPSESQYLYQIAGENMCNSKYVAATVLVCILACAIGTLPLWQVSRHASGVASSHTWNQLTHT